MNILKYLKLDTKISWFKQTRAKRLGFKNYEDIHSKKPSYGYLRINAKILQNLVGKFLIIL